MKPLPRRPYSTLSTTFRLDLPGKTVTIYREGYPAFVGRVLAAAREYLILPGLRVHPPFDFEVIAPPIPDGTVAVAKGGHPVVKRRGRWYYGSSISSSESAWTDEKLRNHEGAVFYSPDEDLNGHA